jgi:hypothetical protein
MNIIYELEQKAITCIKRSDTVKSRNLRSELEYKAATYCDCIQYFTNDYDKWACFDRLKKEMNEKEVV